VILIWLQKVHTNKPLQKWQVLNFKRCLPQAAT
jgi:hypothetical protein